MASVALMVRHIDFYPRPPRGGRPDALAARVDTLEFLSTPSARRATALSMFSLPTPPQFLSTPSARRATRVYWKLSGTFWISIHALREEGDLS